MLTAVTDPGDPILRRLADEAASIAEDLQARGVTRLTRTRLQRDMRIGFGTVGRVMNELEARMVVAPDDGDPQGRRIL